MSTHREMQASRGECAVLALLVFAFVWFCLWLNDRRLDSAEERILALESKPCLLTGAHVGCEKRGAR